MADPTYLHIRGTLSESMIYTPRPGFESPIPNRRIDGDRSFQLLLFDSGDRVLVSVQPQVVSRCAHANDPLRFSVRGCLPLHPQGASYELRKDGITLHRAPVASAAPTVASAQCRTTKKGFALKWQPLEERITYSVVAQMNSGRRMTIARGLTKPAHTIDLCEMPVPGEGKLLVIAHDGVRSSETEAASIDVPERPPSVHIVSPAADARFPYGQPLSVLGTCLDMSGDPMPPERVTWSIDGERFAAGTLIAALALPDSGTHKLTLEYADDRGRTETTIAVHIEEPDADYREWETLMAGL
jgi:hypothetical protein